jgi:drug/metabolite transporter (DMT)-like permease
MIEILLKLISESLLSIYPTFVKKINIPFDFQLWSRMVTYLFISIFFVDWKVIYHYLKTWNAWYLSFLTLLHIFVSYKGFLLLDGGIAYTIFYTYPILILLLSGTKFNYILVLLSFIGVLLLSDESIKNIKDKQLSDNHTHKFKYKGLLYILAASISEALIYFSITKINTKNSWNHVFISYFIGAIILTSYLNIDIKNKFNDTITKSFGINALIGSIGYYLRFYSMSRLPPLLYSVLSYFGVVMSHIYGILFNNEILSIKKIIGTLLIVISNIMTLI